jgi:transmembrane sensor
VSAQSIEREAAAWLAACDAGNLHAEQQAELDAWLLADERHYAAFWRLRTCWQAADQFRKLAPAHETADLNLLALQHEGFFLFRSWRGYAMVASLALLLLATVAGQRYFWGDVQRYVTGQGGFQRVPLSDGSTVTLNTATEIEVRLRARRREVTLLRGEALFNVAHDATRPFEVSVGRQTVRAVGTVFSVRKLSSQNMRVVVTAGRVVIVTLGAGLSEVTATAPLSSIPTLAQGQSADIGTSGQMEVHELGGSAPLAVSWTQGRLWFDRVPLSDAVAEFNRYNRRQLVIADPAIADMRIGGAFEATDVQSFVAALKDFPLRVDDSDTHTIRLFSTEP